jgi:predicted dithiol-disulfide oxidoreductase (DUF899 family)
MSADGPNLSHSVRFPGESADYRAARGRLLAAESDLRRKVEEVAALRRALPLGGAVPVDYEFADASHAVRLSELFRQPDRSLVLYSYMYGPEMAQPCPLCTSMLDSLDGAAPHLAQRVNLAVVAKSPIARILELARRRGWRNLRLISSAGNSYNHDYMGETATGAQIPTLNVFLMRDGRVYHHVASELLFGAAPPGQGHRHIDMIWPLWNLLDFTPEGRGKDWHPALDYGA